MATSKSPTQRSLALLRAEGWTAPVVERWCAFSRRRIDLLGTIDVVAIRADQTGVLGVQVTSASNVSARLRKVRDAPAARVWLQAGNAIEVHGWRKVGGEWICRQVAVRLEDLDAVPAEERAG